MDNIVTDEYRIGLMEVNGDELDEQVIHFSNWGDCEDGKDCEAFHPFENGKVDPHIAHEILTNFLLTLNRKRDVS